MSELAYNYKGRKFLLPDETAFWSVEKLRDDQRGQLDVVRTPSGLPLIVPIGATVDDFQALVNHRHGRYRLTALDQAQLEIEGVQAAYVTVPTPDRSRRDVSEEEREIESMMHRPVFRAGPVPPPTPATVVAPFGSWPALPMPVTMTGAEYLVAEALRGHVQMFQVLATALADRCASDSTGASHMMGAAAELLRAADGAAMPRRDPRFRRGR